MTGGGAHDTRPLARRSPSKDTAKHAPINPWAAALTLWIGRRHVRNRTDALQKTLELFFEGSLAAEAFPRPAG